MIEVGALAAYVVGSFLVPLVKKGVEHLTEELSDKAGTATADGLVGAAKTLWARIRGKTQGTDDQPVITLFEQQPEKLASTVTDVVKRLLSDDPEFRKQAADLVECKEDGSPRWQLMGEYVGAVDARNATISGGQVAGVIVSVPPSVGKVPRSPPNPNHPRDYTEAP